MLWRHTKNAVRRILKRFGFIANSQNCCCSSGGIRTCCCPGVVDRTLTWTFANNGTGTLACLNGVTLSLEYNVALSRPCGDPSGKTDVWTADGLPISYCGGDCTFTTFELRCTCDVSSCDSGGAWTTQIASAEGTPCLNELAAPTTTQCDPFRLCGTSFEASTGDTIDYCITA